MKTLEEVWALIPSTECKGLCWESCGPIAMSRVEWERLLQVTGKDDIGNVNLGPWGSEDFLCPLLDKSTHRCTVYEHRPTICRLWGAASPRKTARQSEGLGPCPHGCKPKDGFMSKKLEDEVWRGITQLSGRIAEEQYSTSRELRRIPLTKPCTVCKAKVGERCFNVKEPRNRNEAPTIEWEPFQYHIERMRVAYDATLKERGIQP